MQKEIFREEDLTKEVKYASPPRSKHNIIVVTFLLKTYNLVKELLTRQPDMTPEKLLEIEKMIVEGARSSRLRDGYKVYKPENHSQ